MRSRGLITRSDFPKGSEGSDACMEIRTGTPIEKWDDTNGNAAPGKDPHAANDMSQGERFREVRAITGMNRKDFADYLGIPYRTMSDWEQNLRTMPGYVFALIEFKVRTEFGAKLPQELDPNTIGNVRRGLEDQLEQNDNMIGDGIINNTVNVIDDNANGIPDDVEKGYQKDSVPVKSEPHHVRNHEKEEKASLLRMLRDCKPDEDHVPHRGVVPELVL